MHSIKQYRSFQTFILTATKLSNSDIKPESNIPQGPDTVTSTAEKFDQSSIPLSEQTVRYYFENKLARFWSMPATCPNTKGWIIYYIASKNTRNVYKHQSRVSKIYHWFVQRLWYGGIVSNCSTFDVSKLFVTATTFHLWDECHVVYCKSYGIRFIFIRDAIRRVSFRRKIHLYSFDCTILVCKSLIRSIFVAIWREFGGIWRIN